MAYPKEDMLYDGDELNWYGVLVFPATSGMPGHQIASEQFISDTGPIPEGIYSLYLRVSGMARVTNVAKGTLDTKQGIQDLTAMPGPDGATYESSAWGKNRVRLNNLHIDSPKARHRGGFYLHDSTKGYTHGCIEVDPGFFVRLRQMAADEAAKKKGSRQWLVLKVKYPTKSEGTNGGTKV
jgi:hypothetical protein